jgi:hypothetical protein
LDGASILRRSCRLGLFVDWLSFVVALARAHALDLRTAAKGEQISLAMACLLLPAELLLALAGRSRGEGDEAPEIGGDGTNGDVASPWPRILE